MESDLNEKMINKLFKRISCHKEVGVWIVRIQTGHKANAFCIETIKELTAFANILSDSTDISAVILTGEERVFTGGMDLQSIEVLDPKSLGIGHLKNCSKLGARMCKAWESIPALTVSAIEGPCVGAGVAISLSTDLRVCSDNAMLYVPEVERGMNMSWQSIPRSVSLIGPAKTKRMFTLAEKVLAELALNWGWADYLCEDGGAVKKSLEIAERAKLMPPLALAASKEAINRSASPLLDAVSYMDSDQFVLMQYSDDYEEGIQSFIEKRKPNYKGK